MTPMKSSLSFIAVLLSVMRGDAFFVPVPIGTAKDSAAVRRNVVANVGCNMIEPRPQRKVSTQRQVAMSAPQYEDASSSGVAPQRGEPTSRLGRISKRVRRMVRKAIMGYLPEDELSYQEAAAMKAAAKGVMQGEPEVVDQRLRGDAMKAKVAAAETVDSSQEDDDDLLGSGFVQLDVGDQSPKEAEDMMASLRRRLEQGLPPDTDEEQMEKQRQVMQQKRREQQQQQQRRQQSSRPASFDGDTAVAERPKAGEGSQQPRPPQGDIAKPKQTPKLASAEDVERLNRMFGSMGGEPLR